MGIWDINNYRKHAYAGFVRGLNGGEPSVPLLGDVNGDGTITVTDVTALVDYILGIRNEFFVFENADINGDGTITVTDVTSLVDIILGIANE